MKLMKSEEWKQGDDESRDDRVANKIEKGGVVVHHQRDKIRMMHDLSLRMDGLLCDRSLSHWSVEGS